ncbi:MAG TPA: hypothetical protein VEG65_07625, partial [Candidatus Bathyarchaeia archaeon]|nr:hypothetical protein [Candidatus Bathyarchaeia archaeon]
EIKAYGAKPAVQAAVLREFVNYDCQFCIAQVNKSKAESYSLYYTTRHKNNIRTKMILSLLQ